MASIIFIFMYKADYMKLKLKKLLNNSNKALNKCKLNHEEKV